MESYTIHAALSRKKMNEFVRLPGLRPLCGLGVGC